ncbi:hypothetical protein ACJRO7_012118 [Eucalyptus globulus]|uniref:Uncharacterized protein n=1 Tax=Eucalyptus globulus TaxID=34317 RepID=A0ABD3LIK8_EUCGL
MIATMNSNEEEEIEFEENEKVRVVKEDDVPAAVDEEEEEEANGEGDGCGGVDDKDDVGLSTHPSLFFFLSLPPTSTSLVATMDGALFQIWSRPSRRRRRRQIEGIGSRL